MNKRIAFFCDRANPLCHLTSFSRLDQDRQQLFQVYTRGPVDESALGSGQPESLFVNLGEAVRKAGGGVLAAVSAAGAEEHIRIETVPASDYEPPTQGIRLRPGEPPEPFVINPSVRSVSADEFILLPVNRGEQDVLIKFIEDLGHLPGDYRTLIVNTLRRPGIEVAMRRLEKRLDSLEGRLPQHGKSGRRSTTRLWGLWGALVSLLLVLNLAAVADLWSKYGSSWRGSGPASEQSAADAGGAKSGTGLAAGQDAAMGETITQSAGSSGTADGTGITSADPSRRDIDAEELPALERQLLDTWSKVPKQQPRGRIYAAHFAGMNTSAWRAASDAAKEAAVYGLAKLFMFNAGIVLDDKVWFDREQRSLTKGALKFHLYDPALRMTEAQRILLAHFSCIAFDQQEGRARIKGQETDRDPSDVEFEYECGKIDPEKVKGFLEQAKQELEMLR